MLDVFEINLIIIDEITFSVWHHFLIIRTLQYPPLIITLLNISNICEIYVSGVKTNYLEYLLLDISFRNGTPIFIRLALGH